MSKIPCKKCSSCGLYHDLSVVTCNECETNIKNIPALIIETKDIPAEQYGDIDENVIAYVQKCSACGALNFTEDKHSPIKVCYNCHKTRVATIDPVEYVNENNRLDNIDGLSNAENDENIATDTTTENNIAKANVLFHGDNDDDSSPWSGMLANIRKSIRDDDMVAEKESETGPKEISRIAVSDTDDDDDDDESTCDWSGVLGAKSISQKNTASIHKSDITLTAIRYGRLSFTVVAESDKPYMLGRSANHSDFLSSDGRVGNEHCYLIFRDGFWYVKDNHSSNGTAVNSRDIGYNGEKILSDGDELKLGHHPDSMAFKITIK